MGCSCKHGKKKLISCTWTLFWKWAPFKDRWDEMTMVVTAMMRMMMALYLPTYYGLLLCWELGCTVVFSYCDNPVKIFQDEETEAYQELICPRLRMGNGSGQGMNPTGARCELTMLTGEVFYNWGQARQNYTSLLLAWIGVPYWVCRQRIWCFPFPPMWQCCVHGACRTGWAASLGFAEFSYGRYWKMLVCSFLFHPSPFKIFIIRIRGS